MDPLLIIKPGIGWGLVEIGMGLWIKKKMHKEDEYLVEMEDELEIRRIILPNLIPINTSLRN